MTQNIEQINRWFRHVGELILKLRWFIISALIISDALAIMGIQRIQVDASYESWFLEDDPLIIATKEFEKIFGNDNYAAILVEADDVFAPDILRMIRELGHELEEQVPFADEIVSLTDFEFTRGTEEGVEITDLIPEEIPTSLEAIEAIRTLAFSKKFLVNRLFSADSKQAWIMLRLHPYPDDWRMTLGTFPPQMVGAKVLEILAQQKYQSYTLKTVGEAITVEEEQFFSQEANRLMLFAAIVGIAVLLLFLHSLRGVIIPMITAVSSILWVFGAMGYLGVQIDSMVVTVPIFLGLGVSIGYSIHLFNFFTRRLLATGNRKEAVLDAVEEMGWPVFFTAITTVSALLSFYFVPIKLVQWMGLSAAAVVLTTYIIVMTLTPVLLSFGKNTIFQPQYIEKRNRWLDEIFTRYSHWILKQATPVMIVFVLGTLFFLWGATKMYVSMNLIKTVGLKVPYVNKLNYVGHAAIGAMNSYDVTLRFREPGRVKDPEILKKLDAFIAEVERFRLVKRVSSLLDVIKDMNQVMHAGDPAYYRIPDDQALVAQLLLLYEMAEGTEQENWVDYEYTTLHLMVEISEFDTAAIVHDFKWIQANAQKLFPEAEIGMVGGAIQIAVAQDYISRGEVVSCLISLVVISIQMILVFRSVTVGLIGMIPNVAPLIVVAGLMGYFDIPIEMTTMMIIPMILGLAVDDTIHFINHCKLEFQRSGSYAQSITTTFTVVGKAIFMTSFILVVTFLVYMTSIARFFTNLSLLAVSGISFALLSDYFITPILVKWSKPYGPQNKP